MDASPPGRDPDAAPGSAPCNRVCVMSQVTVAGAIVMVLEILGTRIIGPVFGVGLYVWTALLTVTLAMLATGYYLGGLVADRRPLDRVLSQVLISAGAWIALVTWMRAPVLRMAVGLGMKLGPIVSALALFGSPLLALGMVVPIALRLMTVRVTEVGHNAGRLSALSTIGSLAGALLGGFYLVPLVDNRVVLLSCSALLGLAGCIPLCRSGIRRGLVSAFFLVLGALSKPLILPADLRSLDRLEGPHGLLEVLDDARRGVLFMRSGHSIVGAQSKADGVSVFAFTHVLEAVRFLVPRPNAILQIGLGTGAVPTALATSGLEVDVIEIDPNVVQLAREHFGFRGEVIVADARALLREPGRQYDVIIHDAFTGGSNPEHLLSVEALSEIRGRLRPGGVLVLNMVGFVEGKHASATYAVARTLSAVFPRVHAYRDGTPRDRSESLSNVIFFASDRPLAFEIPARGDFETESCRLSMSSSLSSEVLRRVPQGPLITDSYNPMPRLQEAVVAAHFRTMNELLPPEVWIR